MNEPIQSDFQNTRSQVNYREVPTWVYIVSALVNVVLISFLIYLTVRHRKRKPEFEMLNATILDNKATRGEITEEEAKAKIESLLNEVDNTLEYRTLGKGENQILTFKSKADAHRAKELMQVVQDIVPTKEELLSPINVYLETLNQLYKLKFGGKTRELWGVTLMAIPITLLCVLGVMAFEQHFNPASIILGFAIASYFWFFGILNYFISLIPQWRYNRRITSKFAKISSKLAKAGKNIGGKVFNSVTDLSAFDNTVGAVHTDVYGRTEVFTTEVKIGTEATPVFRLIVASVLALLVGIPYMLIYPLIVLFRLWYNR